MKLSNLKLLCSSGTLESTEKLVNNYFYSSSYKLVPIHTIKGETFEIVGNSSKLDNFIVKKERGRYKFYELEFSHIIKLPKQLN